MVMALSRACRTGLGSPRSSPARVRTITVSGFAAAISTQSLTSSPATPQIAQAQIQFEYWSMLHHERALYIRTSTAEAAAKRTFEPYGEEEPLKAPFLQDVQAMDQSAQEADHWNRIYLRLVRELREQRRAAPRSLSGGSSR